MKGLFILHKFEELFKHKQTWGEEMVSGLMVIRANCPLSSPAAPASSYFAAFLRSSMTFWPSLCPHKKSCGWNSNILFSSSNYQMIIMVAVVVSTLLLLMMMMMMIRLEICQKIYTTEDFRVKNLHRKRVIFDIC